MAEVTHQSGIVVKIVGIEKGDPGHLCEEHEVYAVVVEENTLLHFRRMQIQVDGHEETAIGCFWVTDGIDHCCIGFLKRHMLKHAWRFDGTLAQVTKVFSADPSICDSAERKMHYHNHGCALAAIVSILVNDSLAEMGRKKASKEEMKRSKQEQEQEQEQKEEEHSGRK